MKRIISILLSALMVIAIIPVSVFMVSAKTVTIEDQSLAAGQSYEYVLDLTTVDTSKDIVLKFNAHQPEKVSGGLEDNAVLSINGARTLRVTSGNAMHIWDEEAGAAVADSIQWNGGTNPQDVVVTINVASGNANFVYNGKNVNLTSLDLTGDTMTFKFGGTNTPALTVTNISLEYSEAAGEEPETDTLYEVGYTAFPSWSNGTYVEQTVTTNGTDGDVVIVFTPERNNWNSSGNNLLSVNGVSLITTGGAGGYNLGSTNVAAKHVARAITVTIDVATGDATIVDTAGNSGTANVGAIGDKFTLKINQDQNNGWELTSLVAKQVIGNELPEEDTLYEVGYTAFAGWSNGTYVEQTVTTNGTDGDIVIVFTPARNNWQTAVGANLLSVNGVSVITNAGSGNYNLGSTNVAAGGTARVITVTINVATGDATIVDTQGNSGTANVGAIGDKFTFKINQDNNNGWELTSLVAKQIVGAPMDKYEREPASYFYTSFNQNGVWEAQGGLFKIPNIGKTTTAVDDDNTYLVVPTDAGEDTKTYGFGNNAISYPANSVLTLDFMLKTLPGEGEYFKFLKDRSSWNNHIAVYGADDGKAYIYPNRDTPTKDLEIEANVWYTVRIFFGENEGDTNNAPVYAKKAGDDSFTYLGLTHSKVVGATMNYDFVLEQAILEYNIDNIRVDTKVDNVAVKITGFQKTDVVDGKYNVRFVAAIADLFQGESAIGFEIVATYGDGESKTWNDPVKNQTTTVYESISAEYGTETVAAEKIGGKYITAMAITGIPSDVGTVTFTVKPYVVINGTRYYGSTVTVTVHPAA